MSTRQLRLDVQRGAEGAGMQPRLLATDRPVRLIYVSPYDVLRAATNQISDVRFCEGFAQNGADVEIVVPFVDRADNLSRAELFATYGVEKSYRVTMLRTPLRETSARWLVSTCTLVATTAYLLRLLFAPRDPARQTLIMSRSPGLLLPILLLRLLLRPDRRPTVISWAHEISGRWRHHWVYRGSDGVVATNSAIAEDLERKFGIPRNRLAISLNPITRRQLRERIPRDVARRELGLSTAARLVVYTGKLYVGQKEAEYIIRAAALLPEYGFILTGGKPRAVAWYQRWCREQGIHNVTFTGHIHDYTRIAYYQAAADVLVAYYSRADHDVKHNLPNKICEYMLTGHPIVTCAYPAVRDTIDDETAFFVAPEDAHALAAGIRRVLSDPDMGARIGRNALFRVRSMTFEDRTSALLRFFSRLERA